MDVFENVSTTNGDSAIKASTNSSKNTSNTRDSPLQSVSSSGAQSVMSAKHTSNDENGSIMINASPNEPNANGNRSEEKRHDTMHHNTSSTTSNINKRSTVTSTSGRRREGFGFSGPAEVTFLAHIATPPPGPAQASMGDAVAGSASPAVAVPLAPVPAIDEAGAAYYRDVGHDDEGGSSSLDGGSSIDDIVEEVVQKHFAATGGGWNLNASQRGGNDASPSPLRCGDSMRVSPSRRQASSFVRRHSDARAGSVLVLERSHHRQYQQHFGKPTANNNNPAETGARPRSYYRNSFVAAAGGSLSRRAYNALATTANGESDGGGFASGGGALNSSFHYADGEDDVSASDTTRGNGWWSGAELNENTATSMDLLETMERDRMETTRQQATQAAMQAKMATELKRQLQRHAKGRAELQKLQIDRDRLLRELATLNALIQSRQSPLHLSGGGLVPRPIVKEGASKSASTGGEGPDLQESGAVVKSPTDDSRSFGPSSQSQQHNLMMLSADREDEQQQSQNAPSVSLDRIREAEELLAAAMNAEVPLGDHYTAEREHGPSPLSIDGKTKSNTKSRSAQMRTSRRELRLSVSRRSSLALSPFAKNLVAGGGTGDEQQDFYLSNLHHPHQRLSLSRREIDALIVSSCGSPAVVDLQSNDQDRDEESGHFVPGAEEESPDIQVLANRRVRHNTYAYTRNSLSLQPTENTNNIVFAPRTIGSTSLELNNRHRQRRRPQSGGGVVSGRRPLGGDECVVAEQSEYKDGEDSARRRTSAVCASTNASPEVNRVVSHQEEGVSGHHQYPSVSLASVAGANELYCDHHNHSSPSPPNASPPNRGVGSIDNANALAALAALEEDLRRREAVLKAAEEQLELRTEQLAEVQRRLEEREREVVIAHPTAEMAVGTKPPSSSSSARRESAFVSLLVTDESRRQRATIEALSKAIKKRHLHEQFSTVRELPEQHEEEVKEPFSSSSPSELKKRVIEEEKRLLEDAEAVLSAAPAAEIDAPEEASATTITISGDTVETTTTTQQRSPHCDNTERSPQRKYAEEVEEGDDGSPNIRRPIFVIGGEEESFDEAQQQQQQQQQQEDETTTQTFKNKEQAIIQREDYGKRDKSVSVLRATLSSSPSGGQAAGAEGNTSVSVGEENRSDLVEVGRGTVRSTWTHKKQKSKAAAEDEGPTRAEDPHKGENEGNDEGGDSISLSPTQPPSTPTVFDDVAIHPSHHQQSYEGEHRDSGSNPYAAYKEVRVLEGHRINRFGGGGSKNSLNLASSLNSSPHHPSAVKRPLIEAEMDSDFLSPTQVMETAIAGPVELHFDEKDCETFASIEIDDGERRGELPTTQDVGEALTEEKDQSEGGALSHNMRSPHAHNADLLKMSRNTASLGAEEIMANTVERLEEAPPAAVETLLLEHPAMPETLELTTDADCAVVINTEQLVGTCTTRGALSSGVPQNKVHSADASPLLVGRASESGMRRESPRGVVETEGKRLLDDEEAELEAFYRYLEAEADETEDGSLSPYLQTLRGENVSAGIMMASLVSSPPPLAPTSPALLGMSSPPPSDDHSRTNNTTSTANDALAPRSWAGANNAPTAMVTTCEIETQTDELYTEVKNAKGERNKISSHSLPSRSESESATVATHCDAGTITDENVVVTTREELEAMEEAYARELEAIADDLDAAALATNSTQTIDCLPPSHVKDATSEFEVEGAPAEGDNEARTAGSHEENNTATNSTNTDIIVSDVHDNGSPQALPPSLPLPSATVVIDFALSTSDAGTKASSTSSISARTSSNERQSPRSKEEEECGQHKKNAEEANKHGVVVDAADVLPLEEEEEKDTKVTALGTESPAHRSAEADEDEIRKRLILELVAAGVIPPDFGNQSNNNNSINRTKKHCDSATRKGAVAVENSPFGDNDPANEANPYYSSAESTTSSSRPSPTADLLPNQNNSLANNTNAQIFASLVAARDERRRRHHRSTIKRSVFSRARLAAAAAAAALPTATGGARKKNIAKSKQKPIPSSSSNRGESHGRDHEADDPYTSDYSTATDEAAADGGHSGEPLENDMNTADVKNPMPVAQSNENMEGRALVLAGVTVAGSGMPTDSLSRRGEQQDKDNDDENSTTIVVVTIPPVAAEALPIIASLSSDAAVASAATSSSPSPRGDTAANEYEKEKEAHIHSAANVNSSAEEEEEEDDPTDGAMDYADWKKAIASAVAYQSSSSVAVIPRHKEHDSKGKEKKRHFTEGIKGNINQKEGEREEARPPILTGIDESNVATSPRERKDYRRAGGEPQDHDEENDKDKEEVVDAVPSPAKSFCSPSPPSEISPSPISNPMSPYLPLTTDASAHDRYDRHHLHKKDLIDNDDNNASVHQKTEKRTEQLEVMREVHVSYHQMPLLHVPVVGTDDALNAVSASSVAASCSPSPPPTVEGAEAADEESGFAFGTHQGKDSASPLGARSETITPSGNNRHRLAQQCVAEVTNEDEEKEANFKNNTIGAQKACDDKGDQDEKKRFSTLSSSEESASGLDLLFAVDPHTVKLTARDTQCLDRDQLVALLAVVRGQLTSAMAEQAIQKGRAERYADVVTTKSRQIHTLSQVLGDTQRRAADSATIVESVFSGVLRHAPNRSRDHQIDDGRPASSLTPNTNNNHHNNADTGKVDDAAAKKEEDVAVRGTKDTITVSTSCFSAPQTTALVVGSEPNLYSGVGDEDEDEDYLSPASAAPPHTALNYNASSASFNHSTNNFSAVAGANNTSEEKNTATLDNSNTNAPVSLNATANSSSSAIMQMRRMMHTPVTADAITPTVAERRQGKRLQKMRVGVGEGRVAAGVSVSQHRPNEGPDELVDLTEAEGNQSRVVICAVVADAEEKGYPRRDSDCTMTEEDEEEADEKQLMVGPTDRSVVLRPTSLFVDYAEPQQQRVDPALTAIIHSARRSVSTGRGRTDVCTGTQGVGLAKRAEVLQATAVPDLPSEASLLNEDRPVASPKPMRPRIPQNEEHGEEEASPLPHSPSRAAVGHPTTFAHTAVNGPASNGNVVRQPSSIALKLLAQRDRKRNQKESSNDGGLQSSTTLSAPKQTTALKTAPTAGARAPLPASAAPFARAVTLHRPLAGSGRGGGADFGRTQTQTHSVTTSLSTPTPAAATTVQPHVNNTVNCGTHDHPQTLGGFRRQQSAAYQQHQQQQQQIVGLGQRKGSSAALSSVCNNQSLRVPDSVMLFGSVLEEAKARARSPMRPLQTVGAGSRSRLTYAGGATMTTTTTSSGPTNGTASRRGAVPPPPQTLAKR